MKIIVAQNYQEISNLACQIIAKAIKKNDKLVLGLATGSTPEGLYQKLISNQKINWENVTTFNLDEYVGLNQDDHRSYHYYMQAKFFKYINIKKSNTHLPLGIGDIEANAKKYDALITKSGGIDLQVLGIGENGHIAFNEPGSSKTSKTRRVKLAKTTIDANARFFNNKDEVPAEAITMGIGKILEAKAILLLASGLKKAKAIFATVKGIITSQVPASYLQTHSNVTVIIDKAAAKLLNASH